MATAATGAVALVGSGEYTEIMRETDAVLLATLSTPGPVALLPTASALEPGKPEEWNAKGVAHFAGLGADTTPLLLLDRSDADSRELAEALDRQRFFYFSGGNPQYLVETLQGAAAWHTIVRRHRAGAVVAGCSAGAMMLGGYTLGVRALREGNPPGWHPALGLVPGVAVLPHFDRMHRWLAGPLFDAVLAAAPIDSTVVGIDEDTALVYLPQPDGTHTWRVMGRRTVTVFGPSTATVYGAGDTVPLTTPVGMAL